MPNSEAMCDIRKNMHKEIGISCVVILLGCSKGISYVLNLWSIVSMALEDRGSLSN